jgi:hypothetical protein
VAFANLSLASFSAIIAAAFGIRDNIVFYNGEAPNHVTKIILASTFVLLTAGTAILRHRHPRLFYQPSTKALYVAAFAVSFAIVIVLGFLGGVIINGF